jgi:sortase (surface protein transpeptidase)
MVGRAKLTWWSAVTEHGSAAPSVTEQGSAAPSANPAPTTTTTTLPDVKVPPTIDDLSISAQAVVPVGLEENGEMEVPGVEDIGWYRHGAAPGRPGATVIVAHVWWSDTPGPFHRLGTLEPGARIDVGAADGTDRSYVVVERTMYDKEALPRSLWRNSGPETLVLITCGGDFDRSTSRYKQNIVVYAVPIAEATAILPGI